MRAVLVVTWRAIRPGRGDAAEEYTRAVDEYWAEPAAERVCSEPKWCWDPDRTSHWFVEGELEDLVLLSSATRARWLTLQGAFVAEGFEEHVYVTGSRKRLRTLEMRLRDSHLI